MLQKVAGAPVADVTEREPVCVSETAPLGDVVREMSSADRGAVIVLDAAGRIAGIFTERDLAVRIDLSTDSWASISVGEVMTCEPSCIASSQTVAEAVRIMTHGGFRHLPRVDDEGRPTGIISIRDILGFISDFFPEEFLNLPPDPAHEARSRWGG